MASNVTVKVVIDEQALERAVKFAPGTATALRTNVKERKAFANALAAGYRTGIYHDFKTGEKKGDTPARYDGNVKKMGDGYLGIVYTANYAAQKENHEHNTLLKAKG